MDFRWSVHAHVLYYEHSLTHLWQLLKPWFHMAPHWCIGCLALQSHISHSHLKERVKPSTKAQDAAQDPNTNPRNNEKNNQIIHWASARAMPRHNLSLDRGNAYWSTELHGTVKHRMYSYLVMRWWWWQQWYENMVFSFSTSQNDLLHNYDNCLHATDSPIDRFTARNYKNSNVWASPAATNFVDRLRPKWITPNALMLAEGYHHPASGYIELYTRTAASRYISYKT